MGAASLRVDSGVKRIEVNDNGDYIAVNISDNSFFNVHQSKQGIIAALANVLTRHDVLLI